MMHFKRKCATFAFQIVTMTLSIRVYFGFYFTSKVK